MSQGPTPLVWYPGHELILRDIVRAENVHLFDDAGNRYVDLESGVWCTPLGHNHPAVRKAIADQAARIGHTGFNYTCPVVEEAAHALLDLTRLGGGRCVFLCSGSEAVEYTVRAVQSVIERPLTMTMIDSYFGAYGAASIQEEGKWFRFDWKPCAACPHDSGCDDGCVHWASVPWERIGAFLFEPGSSSGHVRFPPSKLIQGIVEALKDNNGFTLVNEVTTGAGRTGAWFGYEHYGLSPDTVALGKGIGNGYPVSAALLGPRVIEALGDRSVHYAQSHQNDPLGACAAREVVRVIQEQHLIERSLTIADKLVSGLEGIKSRTRGRIEEVRSRGLMIAVEWKDDRETTGTKKVHRELVRRGFLVGRRPGVPMMRIDPALTIGVGDIEAFLETLEKVIEEDG